MDDNGIMIGVLLLLVIIIITSFFIYKRRKKVSVKTTKPNEKGIRVM